LGMMHRILAAVLGLFPIGAMGEPPAELQTIAERSAYRATATHEETVALLDALAKSSTLARRAEMGKTAEGRSIPLIIVSDPPVTTAEEAREQAAKGKLVVLLLGNIHAGEVDGKEALPMLARDVLLTPSHPLLKDFVLVFAPIYNADGNERVRRDNRPGQIGPEEGMGIRENAAGLDLNRDFIKLEAPETRALVKFFNQWDPAIFVDCHTTNGSFHQYVLTYAGPKMLAGDPDILRYVRDDFFPNLRSDLEDRLGLRTFPYGDFDGQTPNVHTRWVDFPFVPRFGTNYFGLRGRISVLSEGYSYATYKDRVLATRDFVHGVLERAAANKAKVRKLLAEADARAVRLGKRGVGEETPEADAAPKGDSPPLKEADGTMIPLRTRAIAAPELVEAGGFEEELRNGKLVSTGVPKTYRVEMWTHSEATLSVPRPFAYLYPAELTAVTENLQRHGIIVEELREDIELDAEAYTITSVDRSPQAFQKHFTMSVEATASPAPRLWKAGTMLVRTGQKLGSLACLLLEPQSEDGLVTWNFFDGLTAGQAFPVLRLPKPAAILSTQTRPLKDDDSKPGRITWENTFGEGAAKARIPSFSGSQVGFGEWLKDGEHFTQRKDGKTYKVNARTGRSEPYEVDERAMSGAIAKLPGMSKKLARDLASRAAGLLTKDRQAAMFFHEHDLYWVKCDGSAAARLTSTPEDEESPAFSPDGAFVSFVRANNLYVVDVATQRERALTTDGSPTTLNGKLSWVYSEEVFGRGRWSAVWWSPDSTQIAFLQTDESPVPIFSLVNELGEKQSVDATRYPRPGEPNPKVRLGLVTALGGSVRWMQSGEHPDDEVLITGVGWLPDSSLAYCYVQDRIQSWLDFITFDGDSRRRLFRETSKTWVGDAKDPVFLPDGSFVWSSERSGWRHLYRYDASGKELNTITSGTWDVRDVLTFVQAQNFLYLSGTLDNALGRDLYRVRPDGSGFERLTTEPGTHSCQVSPKGDLFVDSWSSMTSPSRSVLRSMPTADAPGEVVRVLNSNPVYALERYELGKLETFQVPMKDGGVVEAYWVLPPDFDPSKKYGMLFSTYGGPQAPTIADRWGSGHTEDLAFADAGIIVLHADPRPASGKGAESAWRSYRQLGVPELEDIKQTIGWVTSNKPFIDASRVGMTGWSFGGYITAYAMTHSDLFAAGVAGGSPTDWRDYDSIYTERYMGLPKDNAEGYDKTSVVKAAANLHGRLLLVHGGADDNVHAANTIKLAHALQKAGKLFDLAVYPDAGHGVGGSQYAKYRTEFLRRYLGSPTPAP
jgi:dipeptidyl-peptidase 4